MFFSKENGSVQNHERLKNALHDLKGPLHRERVLQTDGVCAVDGSMQILLEKGSIQQQKGSAIVAIFQKSSDTEISTLTKMMILKENQCSMNVIQVYCC